MNINFTLLDPLTKRAVLTKPVLLGLMLCVCTFVYAQSGAVDPTFNPSSNRVGFDFSPGPSAIALQPDGKIILGGVFNTYNSIARKNIIRLDADGGVDATFNPGAGTNANVMAIALQPDGKIIIGGSFTSYNGTTRNRIARLNADGSLDATFNPGTGADDVVVAITLQPDGRIIIGGAFTGYNGTARSKMARLNADGSLDATFNPGTGADYGVSTTALQPDGKIIIGGGFSIFNGTARNRIARLNADGSLDATFNPGTGLDNQVSTSALQPDGKIIIGGAFTTYNGTARNLIARLNSDGSLDASFVPSPGPGGVFTSTSVNSIVLQPDGKIITCGNLLLNRLNTNGGSDPNFSANIPAGFIGFTCAQQPNGKIIIGGLFDSFGDVAQNKLARLDSNGSLDETFNSGPGANNRIYTLAHQPDGKILVGGLFTHYNGTDRNYLARLKTDGSLDTNYNIGLGPNGPVVTTALQPDGKVIIGGDFTAYNGTARNRIARLKADGSLDATFNPGTGANSAVNTTALQPDGKILIGGSFTTYNGTTRNRIARLNADGSLDATFNTGTGASGEVQAIALQPDGKVIIGGNFTTFNGTARNRIARLNADGSLDATFDPGTGVNLSVKSAALQPDGKVIIGGTFTTYNGIARNCIARVNADGSLDATFSIGSGPNAPIVATALQPDGKIIIGGNFDSYDGTARNHIARLNADGTLDATFDPGTGANSAVFSIALAPDGKILIGGAFTTYDDIGLKRIARILGEVSPLAISIQEIHSNALLQPNPNNGRSELVWESPSSQPARLEVFSVTGQRIYSINVMTQHGPNRLPLEVSESGVYFVHLSLEDGSRLMLKMMSSVGE